MTRRICAFQCDEKYYISQEFNGDKSEQSRWNSTPSLSHDWADVVGTFNGSKTLDDFVAAVHSLENAYGYEHVELEVVDALPNTEEVWLLSNGSLGLYSKYGELQANYPSFIDDLMDGTATMADIDKYVEYWHTHETGRSLQDFLGLTDDEFEEWGKSSDESLESIIANATKACEEVNKGVVGKNDVDIEKE